MNNRKAVCTLELEVCVGFQVVERTTRLLTYHLICWLEISATRMHPKEKKSVLRYWATINEICLVFPPENVALGSCFPLCVSVKAALTAVGLIEFIWDTQGHLHRGCCALRVVPHSHPGRLWQWALSAQGWLKDFSAGMRESWDARLQMGRSV